MDRQRAVYCALLFILVSIPCCLACNGFKITKLKVGNCKPGGDDIVKVVENVNIKLNDDCTVKLTGCLTLTKKVNSAMIRYAAKKGLIGITGNKDICKEVTKASDDVTDFLRFLNIDPKCPLAPMRVCGPARNYDITKYKGYLSMLQGDATVEVNGKTDSGNMCIKAALTLAKTSKG